MAHIGIELTPLFAFQESENPAFVPLYSQIRFRLIPTLFPVLLLGSLGIGKRCFESRNISTNSNPFADGLLLSREISKVSFGLPEGFSVTAENGSSKVCFELLKTFRVTPKTLPPGCLSEVGQPVLTCGVLYPIPCTLCRTILSCCTAWYARCRAMPQPTCGCPLPVPAHG